MNTHIFKLPTGVECELKELTGKQQRILTEQKNKKLGENLTDMLMSILVRVGTVTEITNDFMGKLLTCDRKKMLTEARQFTMDFDPNFKFGYEYVNRDNIKVTFDYEQELSDGFPTKNLLVEKAGTWVDATYTEYSEVDKFMFTKLPKSGRVVRWSLMDTKAENLMHSIKKADRSSHTAIQLRNPCEMVLADNATVPIQVNLDELKILDIEHLRAEMLRIDGQVDTEIMFEHPEAETKPSNERMVTLDLLSTINFFFPSGAI